MATSDSNSADESSKDDTSSGDTSLGNGGSSGGGSSNTGPSVGDLTKAIKNSRDDGKADLKLSGEARDTFTTLISNYRTDLQTQRKLIDSLDAFGNVGSFQSAQQTRNNLLDDINGFGGVKDALDKCIKYLDELEKTVGKTANNLIHAG